MGPCRTLRSLISRRLRGRPAFNRCFFTQKPSIFLQFHPNYDDIHLVNVNPIEGIL